MKRSPQVQIDELIKRVADLEDQVRYLKEATGNDVMSIQIVEQPKRRGRPPKVSA